MSAPHLPWSQAIMAALPQPALSPDQVVRLGCHLAQSFTGLHQRGHGGARVALVQPCRSAHDAVLRGEGPVRVVDMSEVLVDLQGLGALLFRALTGSVAPTPALRQHLPESPRALCGIIALLLQNDPPRGYRSMAGVLADLQLAAQLQHSGRPHDTFSLARRDAA